MKPPANMFRAVAFASAAILAASYSCDPKKITSQDLPDSPGNGGVWVAPLCLGKGIGGVARERSVLSVNGPSPMHMVGDETRPRTMYFSWTEDAPWGMSETGSDGRIHITKVQVNDQTHSSPPILTTRSFSGFMRASGIAMTEKGIVGTLCAKHYAPWVRSYLETQQARIDSKGESYKAQDRDAPLVLAVCSVDSATMQQHGQPWRIGKYWDPKTIGQDRGKFGVYPASHWAALDGTGYGWLSYSPSKRTWTAWYGAASFLHYGYAMHTYFDDASVVDSSSWPLPPPGIQSRQEDRGAWADYSRSAQPDHQSGSMWRYHPLNKDIYLMKHVHGEVMYMQQVGLADRQGGFYIAPGPTNLHDGGRVNVANPRNAGEVADGEGAMRPCGNDMIAGFVTEKGSICARFNSNGDFSVWKVISASLPITNPGKLFQNRQVRLATLGSKESEGRCDRFLFGYWTEDNRRWLVEVNGECEMLTTPMDVTKITTWPNFQEWTTTAEGAVAWVTAWQKNEDGTPLFNRWGWFEETSETDGYRVFGTHIWPNGAASGSKQEAQLTMYWPKDPSVAPGPVPRPTPRPTPRPASGPNPAPYRPYLPSLPSRKTPAPSSGNGRRPIGPRFQSSTRSRSDDGSASSIAVDLEIEPVDVAALENDTIAAKKVGEALRSSISEVIDADVETFVMYEADGSAGKVVAVETLLTMPQKQTDAGTSPETFVSMLTSEDSDIARRLTDDIASKMSNITESMQSGQGLSVRIVAARTHSDAVVPETVQEDDVQLMGLAFGRFNGPAAVAIAISFIQFMMQ